MVMTSATPRELPDYMLAMWAAYAWLEVVAMRKYPERSIERPLF